MRVVVFAIILCYVVAGAVAAADPPKVSLDVKAMSLKDVTDQVAKQASIPIVLDPNAKGTVTITANDIEVGHALDVITKSNSLTWKKLQFAKSQDSKVSLDQLKSGILALAAMPLTGLAVEDPATKTSAVFAKNIPSTPDTSQVGLPAGYAWSTVYVILAPEALAPAKTASTASENKVQSVSQAQTQSYADLAGMSSQERQQVFQNQWVAAMRLTPQARHDILRDQIRGMAGLDQQSRTQLMQDLQHAFRSLFPSSSQRSQRSRR